MTDKSVVRARIDARTKKEAAAVLEAMGLTLSDAFRLLVKRIAADRALPYDLLVADEKTIAAMREAYAGERLAVAAELTEQRRRFVWGWLLVPPDGRELETAEPGHLASVRDPALEIGF